MKKKVMIGLLITLMSVSMLPLTRDIRAAENEASNSLVLDFSFSRPVTSKGSSGYDSVEMSDLPKYGASGEPILPMKTVRVLIPQGKEMQNVNVTSGSRIVLEGRFNVDFGKTPVNTVSNVSVEDYPKPEIFGSADAFPGVLFSDVSEQDLRGYRILLVTLHPVHFVPLLGELYYFDTMTVTVTLKETGEISQWFRNLPQDRELVLGFVDNPDAVNTYVQVKTPVKAGCICDPSQQFDYVIITSNALRDSFQHLIDWKNGKGLKTTIVSVEEIMNDADYNWDGMWGDGTGSIIFNDTAAHIRNFIKDAYNNWHTSYVLLGGDDETIPARGMYVFMSRDTDYHIPCDMYYGALDGSWDADNDAIFGERVYTVTGPENATAGEEADFLAEVYIGRAPVDNELEVANFVRKTLAYEQDPEADYLKKALFLGGKADELTEGGNDKDNVSDEIPQYSQKRLYDRDGTYDRTAVISEMNSGIHIVNHDGHAWYDNVMLLSRSDVDSFTNTEYFMVYSTSCYSAAFDEGTSGSDEAIAEHFITSGGGAFAYIGNSRYGWYAIGGGGPGFTFDKSFFQVLNSGTKEIGKALQYSKQQLKVNNDMVRWTYYELNLFGDPSTPIVTAIKAPTAHLERKIDLLNPPSVRGLVNLRGTAKRGTAPSSTFRNFKVEIGMGTNPSSWMNTGIYLKDDGSSEITNGILAIWDTSGIADQIVTVRLSVFDLDGLVGEDRWIVLVARGWSRQGMIWVDDSLFNFSGGCSMSTDCRGLMWLAYSYYDETQAPPRYVLVVLVSWDETQWSLMKKFSDPTYSLVHPSIAIDPYSLDIFIAVEREQTLSDYDILVLRYAADGVWTWKEVATGAGNDRYPSITCEYQYGSENRQYISYEHWDEGYNRADLMFAESTTHGTSWTTKILHSEVRTLNTQTSITNAEGNVYIAYRYAGGGSALSIRVDRSNDFGSTWTSLGDIDGLPNLCQFPSIAATHGGDAVVVAFEYADTPSTTDVCYSYSNDNGMTWTKGKPLFSLPLESEEGPVVVSEGAGKSEDNIMGYFHAVCRSGHYIRYSSAHYSSLSAWSEPEIIDEKWTSFGMPIALTTMYRKISDQYYPYVAWTNDRNSREGWCSTTEDMYRTILIRADGSINPSAAPIQRNGDTYTLTSDIWTCGSGGIEIYRNNMTLDGAGHTLQGNLRASSGAGIMSNYMENITITNIGITGYAMGLYINYATNITISNNNVTANCGYGIILRRSSNSSISGNNVTLDLWCGIVIDSSANNTVTGNISEQCIEGAVLVSNWGYCSKNNTLIENCIRDNEYGIRLQEAYKNRFYHNAFVNNAYQVSDYSTDVPNTLPSINEWNSSYPCGGNYWSDHPRSDLFWGKLQDQLGWDGIVDTPCTIDANNKDYYPLMSAFGETTTAGENIAVYPSDDVCVIFDSVTVEGQTTATKTQDGPALPQGFMLSTGQYFIIETTASYTGTIRIRITYDDTGMTDEGNQKLFQYDETIPPSGEWVEIPIRIDTENNIIYAETTHLSTFAPVTPITIIASVDIKPGSWPNPLNLESRGVLPIAICGTASFDVTTINVTTIKLTREGLDGGVSLIRWAYEDVATPWTGAPGGGHALREDGYLDLTLKFKAQEVRTRLGLDAFEKQKILLIIAGKLNDASGGKPFAGQDYVWILRLHGDVNDDLIVDIIDLSVISAHWYPGPPTGPLGYDTIADLNDDGAIDIVDAAITSAQWMQFWQP